MIVFSKLEAELMEHLRVVFEMLRKEKSVVNGKKSDFFMEEIHFLGHIVSKDGVRMDPAKIKAIQEWPEPVNLHEVCSFLGLCSYSRRFIRFFTEIATPLHDLTCKGVVFWFGERQQQAFKLLKEKLTKETVLVFPDLKKYFQVQCDACGNNIGGVLMQDGHVITYESRVLRGLEQFMQIYEEELLVVRGGGGFGHKEVEMIEHVVLEAFPAHDIEVYSKEPHTFDLDKVAPATKQSDGKDISVDETSLEDIKQVMGEKTEMKHMYDRAQKKVLR
ncbi:hypothetical protein L7F22_027196 [Adiantum nelumboides]|nr:hypothetical protein [Adiantum nelumboides]